MSLSQEIRDYALDIGFDRVGITTADDFPEHARELQDRGEAYAFFTKGALQLQKSARPRQAMPEARAIVSLAWDYAKQAFPEALLGKVGRLYQARCYHAGPQRLHGARTRLMADFLREKGCAVASDVILLPDRPAAVRSGTAFVGRNTFACTRGIGSFIVLTSFLESLAGRFSLTGMLEMSDRFNAEVVQPIMYNYIKDKKYFQRNAAVALGNTGDPAHVPALGREDDAGVRREIAEALA